MLKILLILSKNKTGVKKKKKDMVEAKNAILIASTPLLRDFNHTSSDSVCFEILYFF
jgi:hypothetical protein